MLMLSGSKEIISLEVLEPKCRHKETEEKLLDTAGPVLHPENKVMQSATMASMCVKLHCWRKNMLFSEGCEVYHSRFAQVWSDQVKGELGGCLFTDHVWNQNFSAQNYHPETKVKFAGGSISGWAVLQQTVISDFIELQNLLLVRIWRFNKCGSSSRTNIPNTQPTAGTAQPIVWLVTEHLRKER